MPYTPTHTHTHTHSCVCVCVCVCARARARVRVCTCTKHTCPTNTGKSDAHTLAHETHELWHTCAMKPGMMRWKGQPWRMQRMCDAYIYGVHDIHSIHGIYALQYAPYARCVYIRCTRHTQYIRYLCVASRRGQPWCMHRMRDAYIYGLYTAFMRCITERTALYMQCKFAIRIYTVYIRYIYGIFVMHMDTVYI